MKKLISVLFTFVLILISAALHAQNAEMADGMRASGKIYVVVGIIMIVLLGLVTYLFTMDRKIDKLEKQLENTNKPNSARNVETADGMQGSKRIYVVVGIIMIVLLGLFTYLFTTDRKTDKLEKLENTNKPNSR